MTKSSLKARIRAAQSESEIKALLAEGAAYKKIVRGREIGASDVTKRKWLREAQGRMKVLTEQAMAEFDRLHALAEKRSNAAKKAAATRAAKKAADLATAPEASGFKPTAKRRRKADPVAV